ncbi:hypothetical protein ABNB59_08420 [Paenibacillus larvae]|nr:hypothetical protein [Paenibacillus larvae]MDE5126556.1 hypothetical protein [Paenibacillus larvae subsp. larvae]MDE5135873.1 hypothetical protein [Paenibacillus larvae subsp. larvae]MDE5139824.1 hypothetical protein [Paenibacillus larvae subsp. larvae]MDE5142292.1 hypothetical protein [Paenibacillus larvae subsp. larvae]MDE5150071.1 hypothetical protein [Paenibacillus larvae subsp. larvae]
MGLGRIRVRGAESSLTVIALQFLVINLERRLLKGNVQICDR